MTESFEKVTKALKALPTAIQEKVVAGATRAGAVVVKKEAKRLAPVDTGTLRMSIDVAKAKKKDTKENHVKFYVVPKSKITKKIKAMADGKSSVLRINASIHYPFMVEYGTSKMKAQPFLRPAVDNTKEEVVKAFQKYALARTDKEIAKLKK